MKEFIHLAFSPIHFPLTVLLLMLLMYWITVILGLLDFHFLDFDMDTHVHSPADVHLDKNLHFDIKTHAAQASGRKWYRWLLFFNLGRVPFMIFLSFCTLCLWSLSLWSNYLLQNQSVLPAVLLFVPNLVLSLLVTKGITQPLIPVFSDGRNEFETNQDVIGRVCTILVSVQEQKVGQAEVATSSGAPLLLNVKSLGGQPIRRGEKGVVVDYDAGTHTFFITALE